MRKDAVKKSAPKILIACALAALCIAAAPLFDAGRGIAHADPKGVKYTGIASCTGCHGEDFDKNKPDEKKKKEVDIWSKQDLHAKAFAVQLSGDEAKAIAKKLGIADATTSSNCLSCHGLSGMSLTPDAFQRVPLEPAILHKDVQQSEGVSCASCHGPSGFDKSAGYLVPHKTEGWTAKQRAGGVQKLFDEFGLYDTKDMKLRTHACYSCHAINDPELVAADHPHRPFEMNVLFTRYLKTAHFNADKDPLNETKMWMLGQLISLQHSAEELGAAAKAKKSDAHIRAAYENVLAHGLFSRQICRSDAAVLAKIDADLGAIAAAGGQSDKLDAPLKSLAATANQQADKFNAGKIDRAMAETLLKGVAAEFDQAARAGLPAATQYVFALGSLQGNLKDGTPVSEEKFKTAKGLAKVLRALKNDSAQYTDAVRSQFLNEAKTVAALFPGGDALPLELLPKLAGDVKPVAVTPPVEPVRPPPVEPVKPVPPVEPVKPVAVTDVKPPVQPVEGPRVSAIPEALRRKALEEYARRAPLPPGEYGKQVFCLECGMKWPTGTNFCGRCGTILPQWEDVKP
jgi:hypothetical protein